MLELVTVAFLLSVDNVRLACSFGLLGSAVGQWWRLAVLMAVVEAAFPLVGAAVAPVLLARVASFEVLGPVLLVVAAALSFVGVVSEQPVPIGRLLYVLPVVFGLDNLIAGAAFGLPIVGAIPAALFVGVVSGDVSLATMAVVGRCSSQIHARWAGGPAVAAAAVGISFLFFA